MKIHKSIHFLNIDVVLGACASSCLSACLFSSRPGWSWWITLMLSVWLLYTGSHLASAWKTRKRIKRESQYFLLQHRKSLVWTMGVLATLDLLLIFNFLPQEVLKYALVLGGAGLLFNALRYVFKKRRSRFFPGELFALLFYMAGTWLGPLATPTIPMFPAQGLVAAVFALVLSMNMGVIALYDTSTDTRFGIPSLTYFFEKKRIKNALIGAGLAVYLLLILQFLVFEMDRYFQFTLILSGMATILLFILLRPSLFRQDEYYRWTADAVLCMGFLALLIPPGAQIAL